MTVLELLLYTCLMHITTKTLPNNLRTILVDTGGAESATVILMVGSGSRYETAKNSGIAHFFEHMAFKGSAKYPDSFTISSTIEGMGGVFNAFTSKDHTGYWIKGTVDKVPLMLDVLADMVTAAKLESVEIEKEKGVIVEEMKMYEDMPQAKVSNVYDQLLFDGHPLGRDIIGDEPTVRAFDRETFTSYIQRLYHPDNAVLVIAGGLSKSLQTIEKSIGETFGAWETDQNGSKDYTYDQFISSSAQTQKLIFTKATEQAHFILGYTVDYGFGDDRRYALSLLGSILGGGMSSRLFTEVREKRGLCYYVHTSRDQYAEIGSLATGAGIRCDKKTVNEAIKLIQAEHEKIASGKDRDVLETELARVKTMTKGRLLLGLEDSQSVANMYATKALLEHKMADITETIHKIEVVTLDEIVTQAHEIVTSGRLRLALVGPFQPEDIII